MRARLPDIEGFVERDGVKIGYEVHGDGDPTVVLIPPSPITHARSWKGQIHHLARRYRVVTVDGRGSGGSDRPAQPDGYLDSETVGDILGVLDAVGADQAILVAHCHAVYWSFLTAAAHPDRVSGIVAISPGVPFLGALNENLVDINAHWEDEVPAPEGWRMYNRSYWRRGGYEKWIRFWFDTLAVEPHSTKTVEDMVTWALETDPETMILAARKGFGSNIGSERDALPFPAVPRLGAPWDSGPLSAPRPRRASG